MSDLIRQFGSQSLLMLSRKIADIALGLGIAVLLARALGPEGQGIYSLAILLPMLLSTFMNFGLAPATVFFASKKDADIDSLVATNLLAGFVLGLLGIAVGLAVVFFAGQTLFVGVATRYLLLAMCMLPIKLTVAFVNGIFHGLKDFAVYNILGLSQKLIFLAVLLAGLFWQVEVWYAIAGMLAADSIQLLFACVVLRHKGYHLFRLRDIQPQLVKQAISYGFRAHLSNILAFLNYRLDMFILGAMTNPAAVGIYTVSVRVAEQLWIFSSAISSVLLPHIAGMEDEEARRSMTSLVSRNVLWLSVVAALAVWGLSFVLVDALFGQAYHQAAAVLRILLPGIAVGGMARILSNHLAGIGRPQINMYFAMGTVSMNVVLNILLISRLGVAGAALATTITYGANALGKVLFFWLVLRFPLRGFLLLGKEDAALYRRLLARVGRRGGKENLL